MPIESATLDAGPLSPTLGSSIPNQEMNLDETSILGYMINRDDFERVSILIFKFFVNFN